MKKHLTGFLLLLLFAFTSRAEDPAADTDPSSPAAECKEYSYKEDLMAFSSPVEPRVSTQMIGEGGNVPVHIYTMRVNTFVMTLTTGAASADAVAKATPEKFMKSAQEGALASMNAKSTSEKQITIDGNPGFEDQFSSAWIHGVLRVYLAGGHIYQIGYLIPAGSALPPDGERFFASFHLLKP